MLALKLALAVGAFWWLLASGQMDLGALGGVGARWEWLALAMVAVGLVQVFTIWRWQILLRVQDIHYPFRELASISLIGLFFNQLVLGSTGGDVYRIYAVARDHPKRRSAGAVSVLVDRITGLFMTLALVPLAWLLMDSGLRKDPVILSLVGTATLAMAAGLLLGAALLWEPMRRPPVIRAALRRLPMQEPLKRIDTAIRAHVRFPKTIALMVFIGFVVQVLVVLSNVSLAYALTADPGSTLLFFVVVPLALTAMALPINPPGALGTGEALYQYLFALVGVANGSLLSLLQRAVLMLWAVPGAFLYVVRRRPRPAATTVHSELGPKVEPKA